MNSKIYIRGGYSAEFSDSDSNKVLWEVVDDQYVEERR